MAHSEALRGPIGRKGKEEEYKKQEGMYTGVTCQLGIIDCKSATHHVNELTPLQIQNEYRTISLEILQSLITILASSGHHSTG